LVLSRQKEEGEKEEIEVDAEIEIAEEVIGFPSLPLPEPLP
jgi:hypothetical protein